MNKGCTSCDRPGGSCGLGPRRLSGTSLISLGGGSYSGSAGIHSFMHSDVDISRNYGHGTVPVPGRESHTADLAEFDMYIRVMASVDRAETDLELWDGLKQAGDDDDEQQGRRENSGDKQPAQDEQSGDEHIGMAIDMQGMTLNEDTNNNKAEEEEVVPLNDVINAEDEIGEEKQHLRHHQHNNKQQARYPFNAKFWNYIRDILSNAKPVGFDELPSPNDTSIKGPTDANNFLSKVIAISLLNPIQPAMLAKEGGFDEEVVLAELFYGTLVGLVAMKFAPECVQCGSAVMDTDMLGNVPSKALCGGCNEPNVIDSMDRIKVIFALNSDVLYVLAENYACTPSALSMSHTSVFAAVPGNSTGSGYSYSVGTGEESQISPALAPGKYRMHCPVAKTDNYLIVKRKAKDDDETFQFPLKVSDLVHLPQHGNQKVLEVPHGRVRFDLYPDTRSLFVLWVQKDKPKRTLFHLPEEERAPFTTAAQAIHHPLFNALFQERQVVSIQQNVFLSISNVVLVFTDIVDSTKLYAALGDGEAFRLVRKHFQVLFGAFLRNSGRVVKTIGDAVMASFTTGRAALKAVSEAMELMPTIGRRPDNDQYVEIRVGIHSGQATVVPLNGVNDYFGMTTNIAARVQSVAKASECFVTETVLESSDDARNAYTEITSKGSSFKATPLTQLKNLKGVEDKVYARGFRWSHRARRESDTSSINTSVASYMDRSTPKTLKRESIDSIDDLCEEEGNDEKNMPPIPVKEFERPADLGRRRSSKLETPDEGKE